MTSAAVVGEPPGWYGKLSMLGDFAHRRLAPEIVRRIDAWLAGWVAESRDDLRERWLDAYLAAPLLRFAWGPDVVGPTSWFGVLMPSCDNAGRYFPLWVAQAHDGPLPGRPQRLHPRRAWFDDVANAAAATLDDGASVGAFEAALSAASSSLDGRVGANGAGAPPKSTVLRGEAPTGTRWWRHADGVLGPSTALPGLPDAGTLTRLWLPAGGEL